MISIIILIHSLIAGVILYGIGKIIKLEKIVDHYKYEDEWAWPQYDRQGSWEDIYRGKLKLLDYIFSLEKEQKILGKILTNKIYDHCGHPFNERYNILRSIIRDLKLLYNQETGTATFKKLAGEAFYEHTFWINRKKKNELRK